MFPIFHATGGRWQMEIVTGSELWRRVVADPELSLRQIGAFEAAAAGTILVFFAFIFVLWIVLAIWVYGDAKKRGENAALWLIIVLLTGIIGLIIWLVVRPPFPAPYGVAAPYPPPGAPPGYPAPPAQPPPGYYPLPNVACPSCNTMNSAASRFCSSCGAKFG